MPKGLPVTGKRKKGGGRKPLYSEPTKQTGFKIPVSKIPEIRKLVEEKLKEYKAS